MILEVTIASGAAVTLGVFWLTERLTRRFAPPNRSNVLLEAVKEKRRIVERDREEWLNSEYGAAATQEIRRCDEELKELADEEAAIQVRKEDST